MSRVERMTTLLSKTKVQQWFFLKPQGYIRGYMLLVLLVNPAVPCHGLPTMNCLLVIHIRARLTLLRVLWCGWQLNLELVDLLQEVNNLLLYLLKLSILLLDHMLQVHNGLGPGVYFISSLLQLSVSLA
jgi:hypothetical protein